MLFFVFFSYATFAETDLDLETPKLESRYFVDIETYKDEVIKFQDNFKNSDDDNVFSKITFKHPVPAQQLRSFSEKHGISLKDVVLYLRDEEGEVITGIGSLASTLENMEYLQGDFQQVLGIYNITGEVETKKVSSLQEDYHIYLVDVLADNRFEGEGHFFGWEMIQ